MKYDTYSTNVTAILFKLNIVTLQIVFSIDQTKKKIRELPYDH